MDCSERSFVCLIKKGMKEKIRVKIRKTNLQNTREGKEETKIHQHRTLGIGYIGHWALGI